MRLLKRVKRVLRKIVRRSPRRASGARRLNLLIGGTRRSGTSSLQYYLNEHPDITFLVEKDFKAIGGLAQGFPYNTPFTAVSAREEAERAYETASRRVAGRVAYIAWRSVYSVYYPHVIFSLAEHLPGLKVLFSLRDPVDTAYSQFCRRWERGSDKSFEQMLGIPPGSLQNDPETAGETGTARAHCNVPSEVPRILARGVYYPGIRQYFRLFGPEQIHVIEFNDLVRRPAETMRGVLMFLGLDEGYAFERLGEVRSASKKPGPMRPEVRRWLKAFYAPYNRMLFDLLGWPRDTWDQDDP